jgi:hypothetical protein
MNKMTSLNLLCDITLGNHVTRSRISVFYADLPAIRQSLDLHATPHAGLTLIQCRYLLHPIIAGACADHVVDANLSLQPDCSACRALCQDFKSAADMSKTSFSIILDADDK